MADPSEDPSAMPTGPDPWDTTVGNRFAPYSPTNHSAPLWIAGFLGMIYAFGVLLIRAFIKRRVYGWDDFTILAATILGLGQFISLYQALSNGLGQTPDHVSGLRRTSNLVYSGQILLYIALYLSKCSGIFLLRRLFVREQKRIHLVCDATMIATALAGVATVCLVAIGCSANTLLDEHCGNQVTRRSTITALDILTEIWTLLLPALLVSRLQMNGANKFRVVAAFCFRVVVIILSACYLKAWLDYTSGPASPFRIVNTLVWQQALLCWSLVSATIPNLKAFLQSLSVNWGGAVWGYTDKAYGNDNYELSHVRSSSQPLSSMSRSAATPPYPAGNDKFAGEIRTTKKPGDETGSIGSGGSQDLIIRKETTWTVQRS